ncbi:MAG: hypothetical protein Q8P30_02715 [Candidatus Uhrbacteria bacterium]|nr:hypothetical protein [Candidatus Uhrbacteria bacterium]
MSKGTILAFRTPAERELPENEAKMVRQARELRVISPELFERLKLSDLEPDQLRAFYRGLKSISFPQILAEHVDVAFTGDLNELLGEFKLIRTELMWHLQAVPTTVNGDKSRRRAVRLKIALVLRTIRFACLAKSSCQT